MREFPKMGSWIYEGKPLYFRQIFGLWNMVIYPDRWHQPIGPFHWWGGNRTMPNCWLFDWVFRGRQMLRPQTWAWNPKRSLWKGRISFFQSFILFGLPSVKSKQYSLEKNANFDKTILLFEKKTSLFSSDVRSVFLWWHTFDRHQQELTGLMYRQMSGRAGRRWGWCHVSPVTSWQPSRIGCSYRELWFHATKISSYVKMYIVEMVSVLDLFVVFSNLGP